MKSESEQRENTNRARVYKYFLRIRLNLNIGDSNGWRNIKSIYNWTAHEMEMLVGIHMAKVWSKNKYGCFIFEGKAGVNFSLFIFNYI